LGGDGGGGGRRGPRGRGRRTRSSHPRRRRWQLKIQVIKSFRGRSRIQGRDSRRLGRTSDGGRDEGSLATNSQQGSRPTKRIGRARGGGRTRSPFKDVGPIRGLWYFGGVSSHLVAAAVCAGDSTSGGDRVRVACRALDRGPCDNLVGRLSANGIAKSMVRITAQGALLMAPSWGPEKLTWVVPAVPGRRFVYVEGATRHTSGCP